MPEVFVQRFPVTAEDYLEFLNATAKEDPEAARARVPRRTDDKGPCWPLEEDGGFVVPTKSWLEDAPEEGAAGAHRLQHAPVDWAKDWPVMGISWEDGAAYADWKRKRENFAFRFPIDTEWEKAARGSDGRYYTWGNSQESHCNHSMAFEEGMRPVGVGAMPLDESPYGVRGLAGNSSDPALNELGPSSPGWRYFLGGSWGSSAAGLRATYRLGIVTSAVYPPRFGIRLFASVRLPQPDLPCPPPIG
jgi:serine/threonine-protein kinase